MKGEEFVGRLRKSLPRPEAIRPIVVDVAFHRFAIQDVGVVTIGIENLESLAGHLQDFFKKKSITRRFFSLRFQIAEIKFNLEAVGFDDVDKLCLGIRKFIREQFGKGD